MKKVVTVGGGTGSFTVLTGLKEIEGVDITALVSMADDGGSTGVLRDELGVLPPGDVRQCLVALSEESELVRRLMRYRFEEGGLAGHSFGNILLAALEKVSGDFITGAQVASQILKVKGKVVPVTGSIAHLVLRLMDGTELIGENTINHADIQKIGIESIGYQKKVKLNPHAREAILEADAIVLGPGNYYCSVLPCLIVEGFRDAVMQSHAKLIFPVNLTNKHGHTLGYGVKEYVDDIETFLGRPVDVVLINSDAPSEEQIRVYELTEGSGVLVSDNYTKENVMRAPMLSKAMIKKEKGDVIEAVRGFIRHDSDKLARAVMGCLG